MHKIFRSQCKNMLELNVYIVLDWVLNQTIIDWYLSTVFVQFSLNQFKWGRFLYVPQRVTAEL